MEGKSEALTEGVRVSVVSRYVPQRSAPAQNRFFFAYTVTIKNEGSQPVQLMTRHWVITHADEHVEEVRGDGVVGEQPNLETDQAFRYTSACLLRTPWGTMHGTYQMRREDGYEFDAAIDPFLLASSFVTPAGAPS
ncbi:MAG: Co2+/Mg2+ efflux protein ApaG [Myxococcota bacterium]